NMHIGVPMTDPNIFQNGNIEWGNLSFGWGEMVAADPSGSGLVFKYQYPYTDNNLFTFGLDMDPPLTGNDFFQVNAVGTIAPVSDPLRYAAFGPPGLPAPYPGTSSAITGLIQAGDVPGAQGTGQWPGAGVQDLGSNF